MKNILWPPDVKSQLTGKDPDGGKDWKQEKGMTEDEMVGWHHLLNGHEYEQTPGDSEGQGSLACCEFMGSQRVRHTWGTEQQQMWILYKNIYWDTLKIQTTCNTFFSFIIFKNELQKHNFYFWKKYYSSLYPGNNFRWYKCPVIYLGSYF